MLNSLPRSKIDWKPEAVILHDHRKVFSLWQDVIRVKAKSNRGCIKLPLRIFHRILRRPHKQQHPEQGLFSSYLGKSPLPSIPKTYTVIFVLQRSQTLLLHHRLFSHTAHRVLDFHRKGAFPNRQSFQQPCHGLEADELLRKWSTGRSDVTATLGITSVVGGGSWFGGLWSNNAGWGRSCFAPFCPSLVSFNHLQGENTHSPDDPANCMMNAAQLACLGEALNSDPTAGEDRYCRYNHVTGNGLLASFKRGTFISPCM